MILTYSELITISTFEERFEYLKLGGRVGEETFGFERYLNQQFYRSPEWRKFRRDIILRDNGCDLAHPDHEIFAMILIHHLNPIDASDIRDMTSAVLDPNNVVCTKTITHNAIHYGDQSIIDKDPIERKPNDTCPWR